MKSLDNIYIRMNPRLCQYFHIKLSEFVIIHGILSIDSLLFDFTIERKSVHLSDEVAKTKNETKDPDESKDLVIDNPFFHESQIHPQYSYL
jgi:hypothetical protein